MMDKERQKPGRIPVRFVDEDKKGGDDLTPADVGRESSYEGETEVGRRSDQGEAGGDAEASSGPDPSELPERKEDQDTNPSHRESDEQGRQAAGAGESGPDEQRAGGKGGPAFAELLATRAELKRVQAALAKLTEERQELVEKVARRQADFDNYRKRVERERGETYGRVAGELVGQLLPVVDNLQRALDAESSVEAGESEEFRHFLRGVELIGRQLNGVLESLGVKPVPTVGQPFDPHVHEAVATEQTDEFEPDTVTAELVRGYRIGDKLIRPAMVKVAK